MKQLFLITLLFVSLTTVAQKQREKNVRNMADEMAKVLDLSKEESQKIFDMRMECLKNIDKIKEQNSDASKEELKKLRTPIVKAYNKDLANYIGKEKRKKWRTYMLSKKKKG